MMVQVGVKGQVEVEKNTEAQISEAKEEKPKRSYQKKTSVLSNVSTKSKGKAAAKTKVDMKEK